MERLISKLMLRGDHVFLERKLIQLPPQKRDPAKQEYKKKFLAAMDAEPVEHKKANAGRQAANLWLDDYTG